MEEVRVVVISDLHMGSLYGLWNPNFETDMFLGLRLNKVMKQLWSYWLDLIKKMKSFKPDYIFLLGDLIDGPNNFHGGSYLVTPDLNIQKECALSVLKMLPQAKVIGLSGSDYHDIKYFNCHQEIVEDLGGKFHPFNFQINLLGHEVNARHGSSSANIYYEQVMARERFFASISAASEKIKDPNIILMAHWHIWRHIQGPFKRGGDWHVIVNPCFQAQDEFMAKKNPLRLIPDIGATLLTFSRFPEVKVDRILYPTPIIRYS